MHPIHYSVLAVWLCSAPPQKKKKFVLSLTGDINPQSSQWNNGKTKIAYNSTYVQIEIFNFTFGQQSIIVYVYRCSNIQEITMPNAKSYAMPTADESNHSVTGTLHPQCSATCILYITLVTLHCPIPQHKKEICSFRNWRYKPPKSHWNNEKMKIACNSAYVQTETLNLTFAQQATLQIYIFAPTAYVLNAHRYCHYNNTTL